MLELRSLRAIPSSKEERDVLPRHLHPERKARSIPMPYDPYSRANQQLLDGAVAGVALSLACLIGYVGIIALSGPQFWSFLLAIVGGRSVSNSLSQLHRMKWRY